MRVLLIDESPGDARLVRMALAQSGLPASLTHARDAETGLALLLTQRFELVLLDLHLPGTSGRDVLASMCGRGGHPPVIALTSSKHDCPCSEVKALGAEDCLVKPLFLDEFAELIANVLSRSTGISRAAHA